jgi:hypothetical protein
MDIKDPIVESVVNKIIKRSAVGVEKYGTTLAENTTDCFLKPAQEEAMDLVNYLEKIIKDKEKVKESPSRKKTPSKTLRDVLFVFHKTKSIKGDFEDFYIQKIEEIINHFKNKINE